MSEHTARPDRRSHRWFRVLPAVEDRPPVVPDERSMRMLEVMVAGLVLLVAALFSLIQPASAPSHVTELLALSGLLLVGALVGIIRTPH